MRLDSPLQPPRQAFVTPPRSEQSDSEMTDASTIGVPRAAPPRDINRRPTQIFRATDPNNPMPFSFQPPEMGLPHSMPVPPANNAQQLVVYGNNPTDQQIVNFQQQDDDL